jgi:hypothetical protein
VRPDTSHRPTQNLAGTLYDLAHDVGPIPVGIAVSVVAYLLGSVSQTLSKVIARHLPDDRPSWIPGRSQTMHEIAGFDEHASRRLEFLQTLQLGPGAIHLANSIETGLNAIETHTDGFSKRDTEIRYQLLDELVDRARSAGIEIERELSLPATLLVGDRPELFAEVDRLQSEGELRLAVAPPVTAILVLCAVQASSMWLVAFGPVLILFGQGIRRRQDARRIIADAMRIGSVQSSAATRFDEWVEYVPQRVTQLEERIAQRERDSQLDTQWYLREISESGQQALETVVKNISQ